MFRYSMYYKNIYRFLETLTIKFDLLGRYRNYAIQYDYPNSFDENDRMTWPYYLNMTGEYHSSNKVMSIQSLDTGGSIEFTKDNLAIHIKTKEQYYPGTKYYKALLSEYEDQADLILGIIYPIDMETAINAEDFTILSYDTQYLDPNECDDIVLHIKTMVNFLVERWYVTAYEIEELYPPFFYGWLYYQLTLAICARRIHNLHTDNVHMFHVWEYLKSKGLEDYEDILNTEQAKFLYRNINYIYRNQGKEKTLKILAENLLKPLRVAVVGKRLYQNTKDILKTCTWVPEFVSEDVVDYTEPTIVGVQYETVQEINDRMIEAGIEKTNTLEYVDSVTKQLQRTPYNSLPTKLMEIRKYVIDNRYQNLLNRFIFETFIYRLIKGKTEDTFIIDHDLSGVSIVVTIKEAILLYNYCMYMMRKIDILDIPQYMTFNTSFTSLTKPTDYPDHIYVDGKKINSRLWVDIDALMDDYRFDDRVLNIEETTDLIADQFVPLIDQFIQQRSCCDRITVEIISSLHAHLLPIHKEELNFVAESTYAEWFDNNPTIKDAIDAIDSLPSPEIYYGELSRLIFRTLFPFKNSKFAPFLAVNDSIESRTYAGLKNLFVQLCSYNVTFLDTERDASIFHMLPLYGYHPNAETSFISPHDPTFPSRESEAITSHEFKVISGYFQSTLIDSSVFMEIDIEPMAPISFDIHSQLIYSKPVTGMSHEIENSSSSMEMDCAFYSSCYQVM